MSADHTPERRKKPRIPRRLPVRFGSEAKMAGGTVLDISESGLRIETSDPFPTNSTITVFVQFPRHSVRLRARVVWCGGKERPGMGLAFTRPEPALARSYAEWAAEVRLAAKEEAPAGDAGPPAATGAARAAATAAGGAGGEAAGVGGATAVVNPQPAPRAAEPRGPVRRCLESRQGTVFEGVFERCDEGWHLTVNQIPRQPGGQAPDLSQDFPTYAAAEAALLALVRSR